MCARYGSPFIMNEFTLHFTLFSAAQNLSGRAGVVRDIQRLFAKVSPLVVPVTELALVTRDEEGIWHIRETEVHGKKERDVFPLGSGN